MSEVETVEIEKSAKEKWDVWWITEGGCYVRSPSGQRWFFRHESELEISYLVKNPELAPVVEIARRCILRNREPGEHETWLLQNGERFVVPMRVKDEKLQVLSPGHWWMSFDREFLDGGGCYDSARRLAYLDKHTEKPLDENQLRRPDGTVATLSITGDNKLGALSMDYSRDCIAENIGLCDIGDDERVFWELALKWYDKHKLADDEGLLEDGKLVKFRMDGEWVVLRANESGCVWEWSVSSRRKHWSIGVLTPELFDRCKAFWEANQPKKTRPFVFTVPENDSGDLPARFAGKRVRVECVEEES
jgi:hypothetical protein